MKLPFDCKEVAQRLLAWYGTEGRDLPWRNTRDPYRIWLSEIMLQQTTVAAVIPYYERFLKHFPTLLELAAASLDEVINQWAGLGYYSRARNLHRTAYRIVHELDGRFPETLEGLMTLPGVGRSTAGAILSIAFDQAAPILDGNVRRVLVRLFAWEDDPRSTAAEKQLWEWADELTPADRPHDYAQAIMDLGATVCTPKTPGCDRCPLGELCLARAKGLVDQVPISRKKSKLPIRRQLSVVVCSPKGFLLRQRPTEGFLGGLWEFPTVNFAEELSGEVLVSRLLADLGLVSAIKYQHLGVVSHAYSHFKLELFAFKVEIGDVTLVNEEPPHQWFRPRELKALAVHGAHKKVWQLLDID